MTLRFDLRISQGETFQLSIPVLDADDNPVTLSGMSARGQIRSYAAAPTVLYEWTTLAGNLALDGTNVKITIPAAASSLWSWRTARWDIELIGTDSTTTRLVEGHVIVHPEVTRT